MITFRLMKHADIAAGLSLCRSANWNQLTRDWEIFLQVHPDGCLVAVNENKVVGTVTTVRYQHAFSWIGMVLVDPAHQRQGIGIQLLKQALGILQTDETVKLDATPAGREVYLKLNFKDEYSLSRLQGNIAPGALGFDNAVPVHQTDLPALAVYDNEIFGADRQSLLQWMWEGAPQYSYAVISGTKIEGYCLGRNGMNFIHIGPIVANSIIVAKNVLSAALKNCQGKPVILDAMHFDKEWMEWLMDLGFTEQRLFTRMYRGKNVFPGVPEKQFAILGPEFG